MEAFEEASRMLCHQLNIKSKESDCKKTPVLVIDSIEKMLNDIDAFNSFGSKLKNVADKHLLKLVVLASNGESRQRVNDRSQQFINSNMWTR